MFINSYAPVVATPQLSVIDPVTPYVGTIFTLTGVVQLNPFIDTNVTVLGEWSPGNVTQESTDPPFPIDLLFQPLAIDSAGEYILAVTVRPLENSEFILESNGSTTYNLTVTREFVNVSNATKPS